MSCQSINYKDIAKIRFYHPDAVDTSIPFQLFAPLVKLTTNNNDRLVVELEDSTVPSSEPSSVPSGSIDPVLSSMPAGDSPLSFSPKIYGMSASLTVESSTSVAHIKYKVTLEFDSSFSSSSNQLSRLRNFLNYMRQSNYHILITYLSGNQHLVISTPDSWSVSHSEKEGLVHFNIAIENISGAQRVTR